MSWTMLARPLATAVLCTLLAACEWQFGEADEWHEHEEEGKLEVSNETGFPVVELYVTPTWEDHWGPEQLDGDTIPDGESFTLTEIPEDRYDVMAVLSDGTKLVEESVPIEERETTRLTFGPLHSGLAADPSHLRASSCGERRVPQGKISPAKAGRPGAAQESAASAGFREGARGAAPATLRVTGVSSREDRDRTP